MSIQPENGVALGLGGNLGDTEHALARAVELLQAGGVASVRGAPCYRTAPVDCDPGAPAFLNTAVTGLWSDSPRALLQLCQEVEQRLGRPFPHAAREARVIDIDILLVGTRVVDEPQLTIPHPRLTRRLFALVPLANIAPDWTVPPAMVTVREHRDRMLRRVGDTAWRVREPPPPERPQ